MSLLSILIVVVITLLILYAVNRFVPLPAPWRLITNLAVLVLLIVWVLYASNALGHLEGIRFR
jgi:hypothetical protein